MVEEFIPIAFFAAIAFVLALFYFFKYLGRKEMQRTVRVALERGQDLSPELLDRLGEPQKSPSGDLRRGLIGVALAVGIVVFAVLLGEADALRPLTAVSALPLAIGVAYLLLWRINPGRQEP